MSSRRRVRVALLAGVLVVLGACSSGSNESTRSSALDDDAITVGSFDFAESELLAELYSQALEAAGFRVRRAFDLGPREFVGPALGAGLIEFVPEYAGTALQFVSAGKEDPTAEIGETHAALVHALENREVAALEASPAQDANAFVVSRETAQRYSLRTLSDVADVAPELTFGGPPECPARLLCLRGLESVYGVRFDEFIALDVGGALTREALANRVIDVALLFTTDPALESAELVELEDDQNLQPAENVTPLVRTEVVERGGATLVDTIDAVSQRLTTEELRALNAELANDGSDMAGIAARWLKAGNLA